MSDWYCDKKPFTKEMKQWVKSTGLSFAMTPIQNDDSVLEDVGFVDCATLDRNAWFAEFSGKLVERLAGPDYPAMVAALGREEAHEWLARAKSRALVAAQGQLRPGHLRGRKPG